MAQAHQGVRSVALGSLDEARRVLKDYVREHNESRLHSALNYLTPADYLKGADHIAQRLAGRKAACEEVDHKRRQHWATAGAA